MGAGQSDGTRPTRVVLPRTSDIHFDKENGCWVLDGELTKNQVEEIKPPPTVAEMNANLTRREVLAEEMPVWLQPPRHRHLPSEEKLRTGALVSSSSKVGAEAPCASLPQASGPGADVLEKHGGASREAGQQSAAQRSSGGSELSSTSSSLVYTELGLRNVLRF